MSDTFRGAVLSVGYGVICVQGQIQVIAPGAGCPLVLYEHS